MKTNQYILISGAHDGFAKAMTFENDKHLSSVIIIAPPDNELKKLTPSVGKMHKISSLNKHLSGIPCAFSLMLRLMNKLVPEPLAERVRYLNFKSCLQRDIYLG